MRTFKGKSAKETPARDLNKLPTDKPIAVYYRQSSNEQVGNINTDIQKIDLAEDLKRLGYPEENILLVDSDAGYSGSLPIDKRPGMAQLYGLVADGKIGAVAAQDEDRLFRDATGIQYNVFIENCRKAGVVVWTPAWTYVFHHPEQGDFHRRAFRQKCEMAAEQLKVLQNRLGGARRRLRLQGKWSGERISVGYMADMRDEKSPTYRQLVPFPAYASLVRTIFEVFVETGGKARETYRRLEGQDFAIPPVSDCPPPTGYATNYLSKARIRVPNTQTINNIVTDPAYIGHYMLEGNIIRWHNHEPIISEDLFFSAFNYVSKVDIYGNPNSHYIGGGFERIPNNSEPREVDRPLCEGKIEVYLEGIWQKAGVRYVTREKRYTYALYPSENRPGAKTWRRSAEGIDEAMLSHLRARLLSTLDLTEIKQTLKSKEKTLAAERRHIQKQVEDTERLLRQIERRYARVPDSLLAGLEREHGDAELELKRLTAERERLDAEPVSHIDDILKDLRRLNKPETLPHEVLRRYIVALVDRMTAVPVSGRMGDTIRIEWVDGNVSEFHLQNKASARGGWSFAEIEAIKAGVAEGWTRLELLAACPDRMWEEVRQRITRKFGKGINIPETRKNARVILVGEGDIPAIHQRERYADYMKRVTGFVPEVDSRGLLIAREGEKLSVTTRRANDGGGVILTQDAAKHLSADIQLKSEYT